MFDASKVRHRPVWSQLSMYIGKGNIIWKLHGKSLHFGNFWQPNANSGWNASHFRMSFGVADDWNWQMLISIFKVVGSNADDVTWWLSKVQSPFNKTFAEQPTNLASATLHFWPFSIAFCSTNFFLYHPNCGFFQTTLALKNMEVPIAILALSIRRWHWKRNLGSGNRALAISIATMDFCKIESALPFWGKKKNFHRLHTVEMPTMTFAQFVPLLLKHGIFHVRGVAVLGSKNVARLLTGAFKISASAS